MSKVFSVCEKCINKQPKFIKDELLYKSMKIDYSDNIIFCHICGDEFGPSDYLNHHNVFGIREQDSIINILNCLAELENLRRLKLDNSVCDKTGISDFDRIKPYIEKLILEKKI